MLQTIVLDQDLLSNKCNSFVFIDSLIAAPNRSDSELIETRDESQRKSTEGHEPNITPSEVESPDKTTSNGHDNRSDPTPTFDEPKSKYPLWKELKSEQLQIDLA